MRFLSSILASTLFAAAVFGQSAQPTATASDSTLKSSLPDVDRSVDPCTDFYQYACNNWMKKNPIPPDYSSWDAFGEIYERNLAVLRQILEDASADSAERSPITQKIGDFYASCMDDKAANQKGAAPLKPELAHIAAIKNKAEMIDQIAHLQHIGAGPLFSFYAASDLHDANTDIAFLDQGGLTLPDRDYYLKDDTDTTTTRKAYVVHLRKMFVLIGQTPAQAARSATEVLRVETALARASSDRTVRRDPQHLDHSMTVPQIAAIAPNLRLQRYFAATNAPAFAKLNVDEPGFFRKINLLIATTPLPVWKTYLTWKVLHTYASWFSDDFVQ